MDLYTFFQNQGPKPEPYATTVVKQDQLKLLGDSNKTVAVYDLLSDMGEWKNLIEKDCTKVENLQKALNTFLLEDRDRSGFVLNEE